MKLIQLLIFLVISVLTGCGGQTAKVKPSLAPKRSSYETWLDERESFLAESKRKIELQEAENKGRRDERQRIKDEELKTRMADLDRAKAERQKKADRLKAKEAETKAAKAAKAADLAKQIKSDPDAEEIRKEVADLMSGEFSKMPRSTFIAPNRSGVTSVSVANDTPHTLTIRYSGTTARKVILKPSGSRTLTLAPGRYQIAATVDDISVIPFAGTQNYSSARYDSSYYIRTSFR